MRLHRPSAALATCAALLTLATGCSSATTGQTGEAGTDTPPPRHPSAATAAQGSAATSPAPAPSDPSLPGGLQPAMTTHAYGGPLRALTAAFPLQAFLAHEQQKWGITTSAQPISGQPRPDKSIWLVGHAKVSGQAIDLWITLNSAHQVTSIQCDAARGDSTPGQQFVNDCASFPYPGSDPGAAAAYVSREREAIVTLEENRAYALMQVVAPTARLGNSVYYFSGSQGDEELIIMGEPAS
ncbi:hypothetical protein ABH940_006135 [Streptacidiphilus sp. BW17]|uniref:hypothetical protein n=1 Tax=Streptacidiphilus sp. BW17 TaxID=3156274 RepID=UPI0035119090